MNCAIGIYSLCIGALRGNEGGNANRARASEHARSSECRGVTVEDESLCAAAPKKHAVSLLIVYRYVRAVARTLLLAAALAIQLRIPVGWAGGQPVQAIQMLLVGPNRIHGWHIVSAAHACSQLCSSVAVGRN